MKRFVFLAVTLIVTLCIATDPLHADEDGGLLHSGVVEDHVELIELNHLVDPLGREIFSQVLFYDWSPTHKQYVIRDWRLLKSPNQRPRRVFGQLPYESFWMDDNVPRRVKSQQYRETWTFRDPERENRRLVPEEQRMNLSRPPKNHHGS
ncbi:MAG: hypothetical protein AAFP90_18900 [Planctomycetota bacterium]